MVNTTQKNDSKSYNSEPRSARPRRRPRHSWWRLDIQRVARSLRCVLGHAPPRSLRHRAQRATLFDRPMPWPFAEQQRCWDEKPKASFRQAPRGRPQNAKILPLDVFRDNKCSPPSARQIPVSCPLFRHRAEKPLGLSVFEAALYFRLLITLTDSL